MVDSSDFETDVGTMGVYARGADPVYVTAPSSSQQEEGVKPLDRLPAQWWNWFLHEATSRFSNYKSYISNALAELDNLLDLSAITPDDTKTNQLKGMFENDYLQKYLPEVVSDASTFSVDAAKESSILVSNDDGNDGFDVKKVPYSPCLIYNSQSIATIKTIILPANSPYDGQTFKVVFKNGHNCANASTPMTLNGKPVLVNVYGTLSPLPIHTMTEDEVTVYKSLQSNTVLDIYYNANYDGNNNDAFVVIGNPVVLSSADYTIYANGSFKEGVCGDVKIWFSNTIPYGWLLCNGQSCASYLNLTTFLGKDTVPDLRGEFLRGAGTNSHTNQGNGHSVGEHQDATIIPNIEAYDGNTSTPKTSISSGTSGASVASIMNYDSKVVVQNIWVNSITGTKESRGTSNFDNYWAMKTVRPTNTSVNYIIKW